MRNLLLVAGVCTLASKAASFHLPCHRRVSTIRRGVLSSPMLSHASQDHLTSISRSEDLDAALAENAEATSILMLTRPEDEHKAQKLIPFFAEQCSRNTPTPIKGLRCEREEGGAEELSRFDFSPWAEVVRAKRTPCFIVFEKGSKVFDFVAATKGELYYGLQDMGALLKAYETQSKGLDM